MTEIEEFVWKKNKNSKMLCWICEYVHFSSLGKKLVNWCGSVFFSDKFNLKNSSVYFLYWAIYILTLFRMACVTALVGYCTLTSKIVVLSTYLLQKLEKQKLDKILSF